MNKLQENSNQVALDNQILRQTLIKTRSELIHTRQQLAKVNDVNNLMQKRNDQLEMALDKIVERTKELTPLKHIFTL